MTCLVVLASEAVRAVAYAKRSRRSMRREPPRPPDAVSSGPDGTLMNIAGQEAPVMPRVTSLASCTPSQIVSSESLWKSWPSS